MLRFRDGVFFKLDVATTNADGTSSLLTPHELKLQLEWIVQSAAGARSFHVCADALFRCLSFADVDEEQKQTTRKLCSLTAQERSTWAKVCSSLRCCSCSLRCMLCTCTCEPCVCSNASCSRSTTALRSPPSTRLSSSSLSTRRKSRFSLARFQLFSLLTSLL